MSEKIRGEKRKEIYEIIKKGKKISLKENRAHFTTGFCDDEK